MPSWVVPTVAAEYWGVSVEQIMSDIAAGRVASRTEGGFVFVDVDPSREVPAAPVPRQTYRRSLAWTPTSMTPLPQTVVTSAERDALLASAGDVEGEKRHRKDDEDVPLDDAPAPRPLTDDDIPDWEQVRARVARTRRPPAARAA